MISVSIFARRALPGLIKTLEEKGFTVAAGMTSEIVVTTPSEVKSHTKANQILVFCKTPEDVQKVELQNYIAFQYNWELIRYLEASLSTFDGSYLVSGFVVCRIGVHSCAKGWNLLPTPSGDITYIHQDPIDSSREKAYYNVPCYVKNALLDSTIDKVCDKSQLYIHMKKYIPVTKPLDKFEFKRGIYIAKPAGSGAYSGKGITIISRETDLTKARNAIKSNPNWKGIVSEYIDNPLLFRGKKFHVRVYMLVTSANTYSVFGRSHILTAQLPYKKGDYKSVYTDTHGATTEKDWEMEKDFEAVIATELRAKIETVCDEIWSVIGGQIECYPESKYGYEVIAPDIMFDSELNPWLLEVNRKVGLAPHGKDAESYSRFMFDFYQWMFANGVQPFLPLMESK